MQKLLLALLCLLPFVATAAEPEVLVLPGSDMTCRLLYKEYQEHQYPDRLMCERAGQVVFEDSKFADGASGAQQGEYLTPIDFNNDGHMDLRMLVAAGSGGLFYNFYVYSPDEHTLVYRPEFNVCDDPMDTQNCCIEHIRSGIGHTYENMHCLRSGKMITMRSDDYTVNEQTGCSVIRRSQRQADGTMKVVREMVRECPSVQ